MEGVPFFFFFWDLPSFFRRAFFFCRPNALFFFSSKPFFFALFFLRAFLCFFKLNFGHSKVPRKNWMFANYDGQLVTKCLCGHTGHCTANCSALRRRSPIANRDPFVFFILKVESALFFLVFRGRSPSFRPLFFLARPLFWFKFQRAPPSFRPRFFFLPKSALLLCYATCHRWFFFNNNKSCHNLSVKVYRYIVTLNYLNVVFHFMLVFMVFCQRFMIVFDIEVSL